MSNAKASEWCSECGATYRRMVIERGCSAVCRQAIADCDEAQGRGEHSHP